MSIGDEELARWEFRGEEGLGRGLGEEQREEQRPGQGHGQGQGQGDKGGKVVGDGKVVGSLFEVFWKGGEEEWGEGNGDEEMGDYEMGEGSANADGNLDGDGDGNQIPD